MLDGAKSVLPYRTVLSHLSMEGRGGGGGVTWHEISLPHRSTQHTVQHQQKVKQFTSVFILFLFLNYILGDYFLNQRKIWIREGAKNTLRGSNSSKP